MGEMADYVLEMASMEDELLLAYHFGKISDAEAYEAGLIDELGYEVTYARSKTCRCCGNGNLHWEMVINKWLLHEENGHLHNCPVNPYQALL
jgi:hypothetical protein